ncbi:ground-like domain-containing protein [Ditylenchus destructor]|nr:ground-like domain-containing protein [Ditylenchus destructor]
MNARSPNQALFLLLFAVVVQRSEQCLRNNNMAQEALIRPYNDPYSNGGNRFLQQQQQQFQDQQFQQQPQQQFQNQQSQQQQSSSSNQQNQAQSSQQQAPSQQQPMDQTQVDAVDQADNQRLPLPECFLGASRMVCCNRQLEQTLLSQAANSLRRFTRQTFVSTNNTALENFSTTIANRVQSVFGESFEVIVATGNFASRIHFFSNLLCKVQIHDGYYVLVYATPKPELEPYATAGPLQENGYLNSLHRTWTTAEPTYPAATQPPSDVAVINEDQLWPWPHNAPGTMTTSFPELGKSTNLLIGVVFDHPVPIG